MCVGGSQIGEWLYWSGQSHLCPPLHDHHDEEDHDDDHHDDEDGDEDDDDQDNVDKDGEENEDNRTVELAMPWSYDDFMLWCYDP